MATINWTGAAGDGNFSNPANWNPPQVPGAADTAVIMVASALTLSVDNLTVGAIQTSSNVTLNIDNNTRFALGNGAATATDSNGGTIVLGSTGNGTNLVFNSQNTTLTGGGSIVLSANPNNNIYASASADILTNVNNVISGAGQFGDVQMSFANGAAGGVDANSATAALVYNVNGSDTNSGVLEATAAGGLVIQNSNVTQSGGKISATGKGAVVALTNSTIYGGTLTTAAGGLIETANGNGGLNGVAQAVTIAGAVDVGNNTTLYVAGSIINNNVVQLGSTGNGTNLEITYPETTLTGTGSILLSNNSQNYIYAQSGAYTLTNATNLIAGAGNLGDGQLVFVNQTKGVVDANLSTGLVLDTNNDVYNTGLLESTASGGLQISNVYDLLNAGGTISASGSGHVDINNATIEGGVLATTGNGVIDETGSAGLDGVTDGSLTLNGNFVINNNTTLYIAGTIDNTGKISETAGVNGTYLRLTTGTVTLTGGGALTLTNSDNNYIYGNSGNDVLVNVNNVISGTGNIGDAQMGFVNEAAGIVDATNAPIPNGPSGILYIDASTGATNLGLLESTGTGGLDILNTTLNNAGGVIEAKGNSTIVTINNSSIQGGTLTAAGTGIVELVNSASLDGSETRSGAVTLAGPVAVLNNNTAYIDGTINNTSTLQVNSSGDGTYLRLGTAAVTLTGGGTLALSNNGANYIYGNASSFTLTNVNNVISGAGNVGDAQMTLVNATKGIIDGIYTTGLTINCNDGATNAGLIEATAGGLTTIVNTTVNNLGGTLSAAGANSNLTINASNIEGGTLTTSAGGIIFGVNGASLDGSEQGIGLLTNAGTFQVVNGDTAYLNGTINNTGVISVDSQGSGTYLRLGTQTGTLIGHGQVVLSDNANNYVYSNQPFFALDNVNNTISGGGQFGNGELTFTNTGTVNANGTNALVLNTGAYDLTNGAGGLLEATGAGGLNVSSGLFTNAGTVAAAGGNVTFGSGVYDLNSLNGTLSGGTWNASAGGTLAIDGGTISVLAANVTLSGAGSTFETGNGSTFTSIGASVTQIAAGTDLTLTSRAALAFTAPQVVDRGTISISGASTLTVTQVVVDGTLSGNGIVRGSIFDSGTVTAAGSSLLVTGNLSGAGVFDIAASSNATINGVVGVKSTVFASGTETLSLASASRATTVISGFGAGDVIDLTKTAATKLLYSGTATAGTLTVDNGSAVVATLRFSGDYTSASFSLSTTGSTALITGVAAGAVVPDFGLSVGAATEPNVMPSSAPIGGDWHSNGYAGEIPLLLAHHGF
jgi:hypothetical protein